MPTIDFSARSPEKRRAAAVIEFSTRSPSAGRSRYSGLRNMTADNVETSDTDSSECYSDRDSQSDKVGDNPLCVSETNAIVPKPITPAHAVQQNPYVERKDQEHHFGAYQEHHFGAHQEHHFGAHPLKRERESERKSEFFSHRAHRDSHSDDDGGNAQLLQVPAARQSANAQLDAEAREVGKQETLGSKRRSAHASVTEAREVQRAHQSREGPRQDVGRQDVGAGGTAASSPREAERQRLTMAHYLSHQLALSDNGRTLSDNGRTLDLTLGDAALATLPVRAEPSSPPTSVRYRVI